MIAISACFELCIFALACGSTTRGGYASDGNEEALTNSNDLFDEKGKKDTMNDDGINIMEIRQLQDVSLVKRRHVGRRLDDLEKETGYISIWERPASGQPNSD